jgi:hypothetical protein
MLWRDTGETRRGVPIWKAACTGKCKLAAPKEPTCKCWCGQSEVGESHCKHLGEKLGEVPCGCGAREKMMAVYQCGVFLQCTERSTGKPQRFNGQKIAVCLGCPQRES